MTDLLALTADLVDIPSVSHHEAALVDWLEGELRAVPWLTVDRVGDNLVARTTLDRPMRLRPGRPHRHRAGQRQRPRPASRATRSGASARPT